MNSNSTAIADLLTRTEQDQIKFIDLQFTDVVGIVKNVTIPAHELPEALKSGIWFDGSSVEGFVRIAESDMHLRPDLSTYAVIPWLSGEEATARLICDVYTPDGQPFLGDPRAVLQRSLEDAKQMGFLYQTGPELEFFLLKRRCQLLRCTFGHGGRSAAADGKHTGSAWSPGRSHASRGSSRTT